MINFFTLFPLFFVFTITYYMNRQKLEDTNAKIIIISCFEALFSYLLIYFAFLEGFFSYFGYFSLTILITLIVGNILFFISKELDQEWDLQGENIKNSIVIYTLTILPMYVFLTIFRFQPVFIQIPLSLLFTAAVFLLSIVIKKIFRPIFMFIEIHILDTYAFKYFLAWLLVCLIIVVVTIIDLPTNKISKFLNLSNNVSYFRFDGFPTDINNNFKSSDLITIDLNDQIHSKITDYLYDQNDLYLYTDNGELISIDRVTNMVKNRSQLGTSHCGRINTEVYNKFTYHDDQLLLLGYNGLYSINNGQINTLAEFSYCTAKKYYFDNNLYYLKQGVNKSYESFKFQNGNLNIETIDLSTTNFARLIVISETLFYVSNNQYILYHDPSIAFNILDGFPLYDVEGQNMYFTLTDQFEGYKKSDTTYQKVDVHGNVSSIYIDYSHNAKGLIIDKYVYFTDDLKYDIKRIEIMNNDFQIDAIYNHQKLQPFWISNQFDTSYIANYQEHENKLEYLQVDQNDKHIVLTVRKLHRNKVDMKLPFYTHYGLGIFIPIVIALFIPITNYRESITVISFDTIVNKKKD